MNIWFTADQHYYHDNIRKHCNRPFPTVEEMNYAITSNFNSVVRDGDTVYHLGDFSWAANGPTICNLWGKLKGNHKFLKGNHDKWLKTYKNQQLQIPNLELIEPLIEIKHDGQVIVLCHYALATWRNSFRGSWMLHGHSHGNFNTPLGKRLDVGVDVHGYYPINLEQVKSYMDKREMFSPDVHNKDDNNENI